MSFNIILLPKQESVWTYTAYFIYAKINNSHDTIYPRYKICDTKFSGNNGILIFIPFLTLLCQNKLLSPLHITTNIFAIFRVE